MLLLCYAIHTLLQVTPKIRFYFLTCKYIMVFLYAFNLYSL
nr:MAG TPA: hypothetical protein [Caudoviricetes sp.]